MYTYTTALEDNLRDALTNDFADRTFISNNELWTDLQVIGGGTPLTGHQKEKIRYYMEHLGWKVGAVGKVKKAGKWQSTRGFSR